MLAREREPTEQIPIDEKSFFVSLGAFFWNFFVKVSRSLVLICDSLRFFLLFHVGKMFFFRSPVCLCLLSASQLLLARLLCCVFFFGERFGPKQRRVNDTLTGENISK